MRASGAGDGFGCRRRLRGRRARGRPSSPAALLDRGERRYRERQGKGLGGAAGPECHPDPLELRPPSRERPQPLAAEMPPPGRGLRPRLAKLRPGRRRGAGRWTSGPPASLPLAWPLVASRSALPLPVPRGLPAKRSPTRHWPAWQPLGARGSGGASPGGDPVCVFPVNCVREDHGAAGTE